MSSIRTRVLSGFDDPTLDRAVWAKLLERGESNVIHLTWEYLSAWWATLYKGELLLIVAERDGEPIAIAPFFHIEGTVFFVGTGLSDYMDFIGDVSDPEVLAAILQTAREHTPGFLIFRLYFVWDRSRTGQYLQAAAERLNLNFFLRDELVSVELDLVEQAAAVQTSLQRSMLKREHYFREHGDLQMRHLTDFAEIRPLLPEFYRQYTSRWEAKGLPGHFADPRHPAFYELFLERAAARGWARYLQLDWNGEFLAAELAWYYQGTHYSAPWCFNMHFAKHSPGHVLLRQSVLAAIQAGLRRYDLGLGDQEYKFRLPVRTNNCQTWGVCPWD